jgi:hypothetical protein
LPPRLLSPLQELPVLVGGLQAVIRQRSEDRAAYTAGAAEKARSVMQDRYAFDVGDYGKVGLLRALAREVHTVRFGVVWYMTAAPTSANDGRHVGYLDQAADFRACDPELFDAFRAARTASPERSVARLEDLGVLPPGPRFRDVVDAGPRRLGWFTRAIEVMGGADFVFCDPDNGLANPGSEAEKRSSVRHTTLFEVRSLFLAGSSLVLHHHLTREKGGHEVQIARWADRLASATGCDGVSYVRFRRGSARAFFVLPQPRHCAAVQRTLDVVRDGPWCASGHAEVGASAPAGAEAPP